MTSDSYHGLWIVVPAYNEASRIGSTLSDLCSCFPNVVVVDDGSSDETAVVAEGHPVWVLRHVINRGQGAALQTGLDFALQRGAELIVTFDADGQHCSDEIDRLIEPVCSGQFDVALGSRFLGETVDMPWFRWLVLKGGVVFTWLFSQIRVTDTHNGFRALSRLAADKIRLTQDRMAHASELLDQIRALKLRYTEVPVTIRYTQDTMDKGQSSWNAVRIVGQLLLGRFVK